MEREHWGKLSPTTNRTLTFSLTTRDNAVEGGAVHSANVAHTVTAEAGPFTVSSQAAPVDWEAGSTQVVSWDVANTATPPVNCETVSILWSIDDVSLLSGFQPPKPSICERPLIFESGFENTNQ